MNLLTEQDKVNKPPVLTSAAAAVAAAVGGNLAHMQWSQSENCAHTYLTKMVSHLPSACHKHTTNTDIINSEQKN